MPGHTPEQGGIELEIIDSAAGTVVPWHNLSDGGTDLGRTSLHNAKQKRL